jgi:hypothetical protein
VSIARNLGNTLPSNLAWKLRRLRASLKLGVPLISPPRMILAAGMNRSGSTWLYNAARLLLMTKYSGSGGFSCGWIDDFKGIPKKRCMLVKLHEYDVAMVALADVVLYSYRDVRDVLASARRVWGAAPSLVAADHHIEQCRAWMEVADLVVRYESIAEPMPVLRQLAQVLDVKSADLTTLAQELDRLSYDSGGPKGALYHGENLMQPGHRTDGRHGSWVGAVDQPLIRQIEDKHRDWFRQFGYPLSSGGKPI